MSTNTITVEGHLPSDATIRYSKDGVPFLNLSVGDQKSHKDDQTGQWVNDSPTIWFDATIFGPEAEALAEKAVKGARVKLTGRLILRPYTTKDGEQRTAHTLEFPAVRIDPPKQQQPYTGHRQADGQWTPDTGRGGWGGQSQEDPWAGQQAAADGVAPF